MKSFKRKGLIREWFSNFFGINRLHEEVLSLHKQIEKTNADNKNLLNWKADFDFAIYSITEDIELMVWRKDENNRYTMMNQLYSRRFFDIDIEPDGLSNAIGRTYDELLLLKDNNKVNTFSKVCSISDDYIKIHRTSAQFWEAAVIDDQQILLFTYKIPIFDDDGKFCGSIGIARDMVDNSEYVCKQINRLLYDGLVEKLYQSDNVFIYLNKPKMNQCDIFERLCLSSSNKIFKCNTCLDKDKCNTQK